MRAQELPVPGEKSKRDRRKMFFLTSNVYTKGEKMAREERKSLLLHMPLRHSELGSSGLFHAIIINFIARIRMAEVTGSFGPLFIMTNRYS